MSDETTAQRAATAALVDAVTGDSRQGRLQLRRKRIAEAVMDEGTMRIEDLAERFAISLMTAHRDLDELVARGLLRKTRGMVSAAPTSLIEASDVYRASRQGAEKAAIARAAAAHVEPGQALFMDDSTTVQRMVPHLAERAPLTIITYALTLMEELRGLPDLTLIGLGGQYHSWCNAFMGHMTVGEIGRLRADTAFLSMAAITDDMVFHQSAGMIEIKRAMLDAASHRILLADHTKFARRALHGLAELSEFDLVVVDDRMPEAEVARLRQGGVRIEVAAPP